MSLTPAVSRDGFSYAGDLFAEASGHNRHRRATVEDLKKHFRSGSDKDFPAHWFEAQCMHYGILPSKTKAVARMRLLDAFNDKKLAVPAIVQKLEADLKKEWTKNENAAKKSLKKEPDTSATPTGKKRKHEQFEETTTTTTTWTRVETKTNADAPSKKPKSTAASTSKSLHASPTRAIQTARRGGSSTAARGSTSTVRAGTQASTRGKGTTARGGKANAGSVKGGQPKQDRSGKQGSPPPPYSEHPGDTFMSGCDSDGF